MNVDINFKWWDGSLGRDETKEIPEGHKEVLYDHAIERIQEMAVMGYTSGELLYEFQVGNKIVYYTGWWSIIKNY